MIEKIKAIISEIELVVESFNLSKKKQ